MMKKLLVLVLFTCFASFSVVSAELTEKLSVFKNYLGSWESVFKIQDGKPSVVDVSHWEVTLNGKVLKTRHSINDGMYGGESMIFWDSSKNSIVFYYFTTAEFFTQGRIEVVDDMTFIAYEDVTNNKDGITQVKSTSKLLDEKMEVSTSYLKEGEWTKPESRTYIRSNKEVKFL